MAPHLHAEEQEEEEEEEEEEGGARAWKITHTQREITHSWPPPRGPAESILLMKN